MAKAMNMLKYFSDDVAFAVFFFEEVLLRILV
jgi:hypothetical protein